MPLDHVALTVTDRERSAAFYGEHFWVTERVHDDEHLLILGDGAGSLLALFHGDSQSAHLPRTNHFGFRLPSPRRRPRGARAFQDRRRHRGRVPGVRPDPRAGRGP